MKGATKGLGHLMGVGVRKGSFEVLTFGLSLGQSWGDSLLGPEGTASTLIHRYILGMPSPGAPVLKGQSSRAVNLGWGQTTRIMELEIRARKEVH